MKKKMCECGGCEDCRSNNAMPGFGGAMRRSNDTMSIPGNENPHGDEIQFIPITLDSREALKDFVREIIRKVGGHYELKSHSDKTLGKGTKSEMEKRERQVNYFKNKGK